MRWPLLLLAAFPILPSGCSLFVAQTGTDLGQLRTREQVHEALGTPTLMEGDNSGEDDTYYTHRLIAADEISQSEQVPAYFLTWGLYELYAFPRELYYLTKRTTVGQTLHFRYDKAGNVTSITRDGEAMRWFKFLGPDDDRKLISASHSEPSK